MAEPAIRFSVSSDGKTVKAGGKTYSRKAFDNQFRHQTYLQPGDSGNARKIEGSKVKKITVKEPAATSKKESRVNKKALKAANKPTKVSKNKTAAPKGGGLRAGGRLGGGGAMNWSTK
jgi:hypothetical protein